jgi:predicted enzyme related to lactoylglutathione lyase
MTNQLMHFAIHADDLGRARKFYGGVFGWGFEGFGGGPMDDFCMMRDANGKELAPLGAIQKRKYNVAGKDIYGFECTIRVEDLDAITKAVIAQGGKIVMPRCAVPTVGWLIKFLDTEGNLVVAMQPDPKAK